VYDHWTPVVEGIPPLKAGDRADLEVARVCLACAFKTMQPEGEVTTIWDEYQGNVIAFTEGETMPYVAIQQYRAGLEALTGDSQTGELLIAAAKMSFSSFIVAFPNPYVPFYDEREEMHDDIHPLAGKGRRLLELANLTDPFDPAVRLDRSRPEKLNKALEKNYLRGLIDNAVRPDE
jgi:hypothetical protein